MLGDRMNNGRFALAFLTSMSPLALAGALAPAALTAPALADVQSVAPYYADPGKTTLRIEIPSGGLEKWNLKLEGP